jgi:hypothetical protein
MDCWRLRGKLPVRRRVCIVVCVVNKISTIIKTLGANLAWISFRVFLTISLLECNFVIRSKQNTKTFLNIDRIEWKWDKSVAINQPTISRFFSPLFDKSSWQLNRMQQLGSQNFDWYFPIYSPRQKRHEDGLIIRKYFKYEYVIYNLEPLSARQLV